MEDRHLIAFSPYLPPSNLSVAERFHHFIEALEESGYHINVIAGSACNWGQSLWLDLPTRPMGFIARTIRELLSGLELAVRVFFRKEPCLFLSCPPFFTALLGAFGAHLSKKYYILDLRDQFPDSLLRQGRIKSNGIAEKIIKAASRWLIEHSVVIFTATPGLRDHLLKSYPDLQDRCFSILNGYDLELYPQTEASEPTPKLENKFEKFTCVMHGNTGLLQDIPFLRSVASELKNINPDIDIVVIGAGPQSALIKAAALPNLRYEGVLDPQSTAEFLRKCHLGLSFRASGLTGEMSFPQTVFECLGAGLPLFCAPMNEAAIYLQDKGAGVGFAKKEAKIVAAKINELSQSFEAYSSLSLCAQKLGQRLSRQTLRQLVVDVFNQL